MTTYRLHQPLPLGVPPSFARAARVWVESSAPGVPGPVIVDCEDPRFAQTIRARLATCYGFRGRMLGEQITQDDLHCAMSLAVMRELRPVLEVPRRRGRQGPRGAR